MTTDILNPLTDEQRKEQKLKALQAARKAKQALKSRGVWLTLKEAAKVLSLSTTDTKALLSKAGVLTSGKPPLLKYLAVQVKAILATK